jgi:FixJ family two-component response regulator
VLRNSVIAVIDDDDSFRGALLELLNSLEYDAHGFTSSEAFTGFHRSDKFDCVITDIHMPGMSGLDLARLLRSRGSKIPVIMITARAEPGLEARATASGAICLLRKPFEADAMIACLDTALGARRE